MDLTKEEFDKAINFSFEEISKIREKIISKTYNAQDLKFYLAHCIICGLRKELKEDPNYETFSGIIQFIDTCEVE